METFWKFARKSYWLSFPPLCNPCSELQCGKWSVTVLPSCVDIKSPNPHYGFCPIKRTKAQYIRVEPCSSTKRAQRMFCPASNSSNNSFFFFSNAYLQSAASYVDRRGCKFKEGLVWSLMWRFKGSRLLSGTDWSTDWLQTSWIPRVPVMK